MRQDNSFARGGQDRRLSPRITHRALNRKLADLGLRHGRDRAYGRGCYTVWPTTLHGLAERPGVLRGYEEARDA